MAARDRQSAGRGARGQHFLRSPRLAAEIVAHAGAATAALAVDVGAGTGVFTRALAASGRRVVAVELDPVLAARLRRRLDTDPLVSVVCADARTWRWPDEPFAVVASLPFAGSGEILRALLDDPRVPLEHAYVILEWGAAQKRAAVVPSTLRSAYWGAWYEFAVVRRLAPVAFAPPPSVDAAVLRIRRRARPLVAVADSAAYRAFVGRGFARPLPLRRTLPPDVTPRQLKRLAPVAGFDPDARAHDLDAYQWATIFGAGGRRSAPRA